MKRTAISKHLFIIGLVLIVLAACGPLESSDAAGNLAGSAGGAAPAQTGDDDNNDGNPEEPQVFDLGLSSVGDFVWQDLNGNGVQDEEEPGLEGVMVSLFSAQGELAGSVPTDADGFYLFEEVFPGEYYLEVLRPDGLVFTPQDEGAEDADSDMSADGYTAIFDLAPGEHNQDVDAGLVQPRAGAVCPLTGQEIDDETLLLLRPIFISISIFPQHVRPVTGVNSAPVVFESVIDAGQTRLQALFYCTYPEVFPKDDGGNAATASKDGFDISGVRSGRVFYGELAKLFGAGLIYGGASPEVQAQISVHSCSRVTSAAKGDIGAAGIDVDRLKEVAANCQTSNGNTDLAVWKFGPPPAGGEAAPQILVRYNYYNQTRWIYEPSVNGYVRYMNGTGSDAQANTFEVFTDALTGEPVVRQNILILIAQHTVLNPAGTIIEYNLTDQGGFGWLVRDGVKYKVCWSAIFGDYETSSNRYRPFLIKDCATGEPIPLAYGQTWVHVVDVTTGFEWKGDDWRVWHVQPQYQP